jgi:hypothetical protein
MRERSVVKLSEQEYFADGVTEKTLKNIARPVRAFAVAMGSENAAAVPSAAAPNNQGPPRLSIIVLPFANIGGGAADQFSGRKSVKRFGKLGRNPKLPQGCSVLNFDGRLGISEVGCLNLWAGKWYDTRKIQRGGSDRVANETSALVTQPSS